MYFSRTIEVRLMELFQKGYVKGTVTGSRGNEATAVGMCMPLRPGRTRFRCCTAILPATCSSGADPYRLICQYMANAESPTQAQKATATTATRPSGGFP